MWWWLLLAALPADPAAALAQVDARAQALDSVRYGVLRTSIQGELRQQERWLWTSAPGGRFRVDYFGDTTRVLACDGRVLWDYVPALRTAHRYDLLALPADERSALLGRVVQKVSVPGLRTGIDAAAMDSVSWAGEGSAGGRTTRVAVATDAHGGRLTFELDEQHGYLVRARIEEAGEFVVETVASEHRAVADDLWMPHLVRSTAPGPGGRVQVELRLNRVTAGVTIPDSQFRLELDGAITIVEHP